MTDAARCVVCSKPVLAGERVPTGEDVHIACDRRSRRRAADVVTCIVCNEPILSRDGTARLDDNLVHGACYVRARQVKRKPHVTATNGTSAASPRVGLAQRLLRLVFGERTAAR